MCEMHLLSPPSPFFLSHPMEFHVEATGVADRLSLCVSSPQGGGGGVTVGAGQAHPPRGRLQRMKYDREKTFFIYEKDKMTYEFIIHVLYPNCIASLCSEKCLYCHPPAVFEA